MHGERRAIATKGEVDAFGKLLYWTMGQEWMLLSYERLFSLVMERT